MKIFLSCPTCFRENGRPPDDFVFIELAGDHYYKATCQRGHKFATRIQQQNFEVLFDIAAIALADGYSREAVSNVAAALERFYEFYLKFVCVDSNLDIRDFRVFWKPLSRLSERQLGAFSFAYFLCNQKEPPSLANKWVKFRNNVVHNGYFPPFEEAMTYGDEVMTLLVSLIQEMREKNTEAIQRVVVDDMIQKSDSVAEKTIDVSTMSIPTILSLTISESELLDRSFSSEVEKLKLGKSWRPYSR